MRAQCCRRLTNQSSEFGPNCNQSWHHKCWINQRSPETCLPIAKRWSESLCHLHYKRSLRLWFECFPLCSWSLQLNIPSTYDRVYCSVRWLVDVSKYSKAKGTNYKWFTWTDGMTQESGYSCQGLGPGYTWLEHLVPFSRRLLADLRQEETVFCYFSWSHRWQMKFMTNRNDLHSCFAFTFPVT